MCLLLCKLSAQLDATYGFTVPSVAAAQKYRAFFKAAGRSRVLTPGLLNATSLAEVTELAATMQQSAEQVLQSRHTLDETYNDGIYALDGAALNKQLTTDFATAWKRMSGAYRKLFRSIRRTCKEGKSIRYADAVKATELLSVYQRQTAIFRNAEAQLDNRIGCYDGLNTDWNAVTKELAAAKEYIPGTDFGTLAKMTNEVFAARKDTFNTLAGWLDAAFSDEAELGKLINDYDKTEFDITGVALAKTYDKANACLAATDQLDNWCRFCRLTNRLAELSAMDFVNKALDEHLPLNQLDKVYAKLFFTQWVDEILHVTPSLTELSRIPHDKLVETFAEKDRLQFEINKAAIKATLSETRPDLEMISARSQVSVLLREGEKKRKQKGIRQLLADTWQLTQTLKPCFLMSPLSVSTFLGPDMNFDVVIFDEASQMPTAEAIGSLARAKSAIIVGDPKQLPPTAFFDSNRVDEDEIETEDMESVLDDCLALGVDERHLVWHYRSKHESLIAFSNVTYYGNKLCTFPSPDAPDSRVKFVYVEDGLYDRGFTKRNKPEADALVKEVIRHLKDPVLCRSSIGVVTFSSVQRDYIERRLTAAISNEKLEERAYEREEPVFVKNLENVQGDERDVVLFSVCYGPDKNGRISLNFGPLNQAGGWRRLNVAASRAREEMIVFSSITGAMIDLSKTNSKGVAGLKAFLNFAEKGKTTLAVSSDSVAKTRAGLGKYIAAALSQYGYECRFDVGVSDFKIDVAVLDPKNKHRFILAVMCDGNDKFSVKDRNVLQIQTLKRNNWNVTRVFAVNYYNNPKREIKRIKDLLDRITGRDKKTGSGIAKAQKAYKCANVTQLFETADYVTSGDNDAEIVSRLKAIVGAEEPISEKFLIRRTLSTLGILKFGNKVENRMLALIPLCGFKREKMLGEFYYRKTDKPVTFDKYRVETGEKAVRRYETDFTPYEIIALIKAALEDKVALYTEEIASVACVALRLPKVTDKFAAYINDCVTLGEERGLFVRSVSDRISLA